MGLLSAKPIQRAVAENPLEQHRQFARGFVSVVMRQLHHAVLNDVQCRFLVAHMKVRALERSFFDAFKELGEFLFGGQEKGRSRVRMPLVRQ